MSSITSAVVNFLLAAEPHSSEVGRKAVEHVIDGVGVMLAGSRAECAQKLAGLIFEEGGRGDSTLIGFDFTSRPTDAALLNGTSGHADDYDDTQLSSSPDRVYGLLTHPTVPVLSASLAVGERVGCSGREFLEAFIAGFEVECKLAEAIKPVHYRKGFHTTGTMGTFGAATASAKLLRLDEEGLRHAIGIAASMASGIRANFGTMTKPLHAGRAASNGVAAALLADRGFTADKDALDGRWGFMNILGDGAETEKILGRLGNPYTLIHPGASIKMYPCGSLAQPSMDAMLDIVTEENLKPEDVREIRLRAGPNILEPLRYRQPVDGLQAKFSLEFGLASILVKRRAGLREYTTDCVNSSEIRDAMKKVRTILDEDIASMGAEKMRSVVEVELKDGRRMVRHADTSRGTPDRPLKDHELDEKFRECASFVLERDKIDRVLRMLRGVEGVSTVRELTSLLVSEK